MAINQQQIESLNFIKNEILSKGKLNQAFEELKSQEFTIPTYYESILLTLEAHHSDSYQSLSINLISDSEYSRRCSRITYSILNIINKLIESPKNLNTQPDSQTNPHEKFIINTDDWNFIRPPIVIDNIVVKVIIDEDYSKILLFNFHQNKEIHLFRIWISFFKVKIDFDSIEIYNKINLLKYEQNINCEEITINEQALKFKVNLSFDIWTSSLKKTTIYLNKQEIYTNEL